MKKQKAILIFILITLAMIIVSISLSTKKTVQDGQVNVSTNGIYTGNPGLE